MTSLTVRTERDGTHTLLHDGAPVAPAARITIPVRALLELTAAGREGSLAPREITVSYSFGEPSGTVSGRSS